MPFSPPQVREMTAKLCQICGCDIFIIPKDMHIDLNIFRRRLVKYLQQKSLGRHTYKSLFVTTSAAHYKYIVFSDLKYLHTTISDASQ